MLVKDTFPEFSSSDWQLNLIEYVLHFYTSGCFSPLQGKWVQTPVSAPLVRVPLTKAWREGSPFSPLNLSWERTATHTDLSENILTLYVGAWVSVCMCALHKHNIHSMAQFPAFDQQIHKGTQKCNFLYEETDLNNLQQVQTGVSQSPRFRV